MTTINPEQISIMKRKVSTFSERSNNGQTHHSTSNSLITTNQNLLIHKNDNSKYFHLFNDHLTRIKTNYIINKPLIRLKRMAKESAEQKKKNTIITNQKIISNISQEHFIETITSNIKTVITFSLMYEFIINPLPQNIALVCNMMVRYDNIIERFYPQFVLSFNSNERIILRAQKELTLTSTVYKIYFWEKESRVIGEVKSNFLGNEFKIMHLYNDQKGLKQKKTIKGFIKYDCQGFNIEHNLRRNITVFLPMNINLLHNQLENSSKSLCKTTLQNNNKNNLKKTNNMVVLLNKKPIWSKSKQHYSYLL